MDPLYFLIVVGCVTLIVIAVAALSGHRRAARRDAMAQFAESLGLSFDPTRDYDHDDRYAHMEMFGRGSKRYAYNTISGRMTLGGHELGVIFGDFHYAVHQHGQHGPQKRSAHFSYLVIELPWSDVPDLLIRTEGFFDRVGAMIGFDDIDFESEEFSRAFLVKSPDRKFAYDLIDPRMMEFLLETRPDLIDLEHGSMGFASGFGLWDVQKFRNGLDWVDEFFARWPDHVIRNLEGGVS